MVLFWKNFIILKARQKGALITAPLIFCNVTCTDNNLPKPRGPLIPVYVTRPSTALTPTPGTVHVRGGPQTRDQWNHDSLRRTIFCFIRIYICFTAISRISGV